MTDLATVERSLAFFRSLDFFAGTARSTSDLARDLVARYQAEWGAPFDPDHEWADLLLLRYDTSRVWWRDTEGLWLPGENAYTRTLQEWAAISRGVFQPTGVCEWWDQGRVIVCFTLAGQLYSISAQALGDYFDISVLIGVNEAITPTGYRFEAYDTGDTSLFLVVLTPEEKAALQERVIGPTGAGVLCPDVGDQGKKRGTLLRFLLSGFRCCENRRLPSCHWWWYNRGRSGRRRGGGGRGPSHWRCSCWG